MMVHGQYKAVAVVVGGAGSVWCGTDWYLVVLGQYSLILLGIK